MTHWENTRTHKIREGGGEGAEWLGPRARKLPEERSGKTHMDHDDDDDGDGFYFLFLQQ